MNKEIGFMICLFFFPFFFSNGQENRALFIGIDTYPESSGWYAMHGTNDLEPVLSMLLANGYKEERIVSLLNEDAIKRNITGALRQLAQDADPGDYIYIHFSCHGQQMLDDNGDEADGLDEAIVPYDAQRRYKKGIYEGENHLRDDELGELLEDIRKKTGKEGNMIVVLDACHSGTGTRYADEDYLRGTSYIFTPYDEQPDLKTIREEGSLKKKPDLSPLTVFSACQPEEKNHEIYRTEEKKHFGLLSYSLCRIANDYTHRISTAHFAKILENEMRKNSLNKKWKQTPYIESTDEQNKFMIGR